MPRRRRLLLSVGEGAGFAMNYVVVTLIVAVLLGLNARWALFSVLLAAFLIYLFR